LGNIEGMHEARILGWVAAALLLGAFAFSAPLEAGPYPKLFGTR